MWQDEIMTFTESQYTIHTIHIIIRTALFSHYVGD